MAIRVETYREKPFMVAVKYMTVCTTVFSTLLGIFFHMKSAMAWFYDRNILQPVWLNKTRSYVLQYPSLYVHSR
jgi:hypothetical protein